MDIELEPGKYFEPYERPNDQNMDGRILYQDAGMISDRPDVQVDKPDVENIRLEDSRTVVVESKSICGLSFNKKLWFQDLFSGGLYSYLWHSWRRIKKGEWRWLIWL